MKAKERDKLHVKDIEWAQECIQGNESAFLDLRAVFAEKGRAVLMQRGASRTQADDMVQDLLGDCVTQQSGRQGIIQKYDGRLSLQNWLILVLLRRWIDYKRRSWRFDQFEIYEELNDSGTPNVSPTSRDFGEVLSKFFSTAISELDVTSRVLLKLVYLYNLPQNRLAVLLGWHTSKVSRKLSSTIQSGVTIFYLER